MLTLAVVSATVLFVGAYDLSCCLACYRDANSLGKQERPSGRTETRRLAPNQVTLRHALLFLAQKLNYYWQLVTALFPLLRLYARPKRTVDRDIALLLINTSLATWTETARLGADRVLVSLCFEGFAFPFMPDRFDNRLVVETELHLNRSEQPAPFEAHTRRFDLNDLPISSLDEQLSILAVMISSVSHPVIHSFQNSVYAKHAEPKLKAYEDFFLHGQYLNWCAWVWPGRMFRIPAPRRHHWYKQVLEHNAELPLPRKHAASLAALTPYSRSVCFLLAARPVFFRLCAKYDLPINPEALFLCTILHAVDHASCDMHTRGHRMRHEKLPNKGLFNLIALLFYRPAQHFWTNRLRDKRGKNALYRELYAELCKLDRGLADEVTLSISY